MGHCGVVVGGGVGIGSKLLREYLGVDRNGLFVKGNEGECGQSNELELVMEISVNYLIDTFNMSRDAEPFGRNGGEKQCEI